MLGSKARRFVVAGVTAALVAGGALAVTGIAANADTTNGAPVTFGNPIGMVIVDGLAAGTINDND